MVCDDQPHARLLAWRRILKARAEFSGQNNIRAFILPKINMEAEIYFDMVDWKSSFTEPLLTTVFTNEEIEEFIQSGDTPNNPPWKGIPCRFQAVERNVKLVTEASRSVCGPHNRDEFIRITIASRKRLPKFDNKGQYLA